MKHDKLAISSSQFEAIKLQIRVELNKCKAPIDPVYSTKVQPERKHFISTSISKASLLQNKENIEQERTPKGKKHFYEPEATLSPLNIHRQRKHFARHNAHNTDIFVGQGSRKTPTKQIKEAKQGVGTSRIVLTNDKVKTKKK